MDREEFNYLYDLVFESYSNKENYLDDWKIAQKFILNKQLDRTQDKKFKKNEDTVLYLTSLQRIIDSMVWLSLKKEKADLRKFIGQEVELANLAHHNIDKHQKFAEEINSEFENHIAIISDLGTSFNIGDLLVLNKFNAPILPVEVKTGVMNEKILDAIKLKDSGDNSKYLEVQSSEKSSKQLSRIESQKKKLADTMEIYLTNEVNSEEGIRRVFEKDYHIATFEYELNECIKKALVEGGSWERVEECLTIIAYRVDVSDEYISKYLSEAFGDTSDDPISFSIFSLETKENPHCCPIFALNIDKDLKFELLQGNIFVLIAFHNKTFCKKYSDEKVQYFYTEGIKESSSFERHEFDVSLINDTHNIFVRNIKKETSVIGPGSYERVFNYLIRPSCFDKIQRILLEEYYKIMPNIIKGIEEKK